MTNSVPILCVGVSCLDIVSDCASYPEENAKVGTTTQPNRCLCQKWERGGNASNTSTVLALLGSSPTLACTLANSPEKQFLVSDIAKYGIADEWIVYHDGVACPSSVVICSRETGSRTIIHSNQNLPELSVEDFKKIPLQNFKWVHFEGRNIENVLKMQKIVRETAPSLTMSVELEKVRPDIEQLGHNADVVFVSKEFAQHLGYSDMRSAATGIATNTFKSCAKVIVPWGEEGACGYSSETGAVSSKAFVPEGGVKSSLGAGDTFIAAAVHALARGRSLEDSVTFGCRVAGLKVGLGNYDALKGIIETLDWVKKF